MTSATTFFARLPRVTVLTTALLAIAACGTSGDEGGGTADDAAGLDTGTIADTGGVADSGGSVDSGGAPDTAGPVDAGATSDTAGPVDAGATDTGSPDAGSPDAGSADTGDDDAGSPDAGSADAGPQCPGPVGCDCKDSKECDLGACVSGKCVDPCKLGANDKKPDEICDGTDNDCDGKTDNVDCSDGEACTGDFCNPAKKACQHTPVTDGTACDDGNKCKGPDSCKSGKCAAAGDIDCSDGNACTDDSCDAKSGCKHADNKATCDDGSKCTTGDACAAGKCGGKAVVCDDNNPCTDDGCDLAKGCTTTTNTAACNDANACTTKDACKAGKCAGGPTRVCDDKDPCTTDSCDTKKGCQHVANKGPCEDANKCTIKETCKAGKCVSGGKQDCNDKLVCTKDSCDPKKGCVNAPLSKGVCNDGSKCTTGDSCKAGKCAGKKLVCNDANACTKDSCDAKKGCIHNAATGTACNDGNKCTVKDTCKAGKCAAGSALKCNDKKACTSDSCNPKMGCVYKPTTAICSDGNTCFVSTCETGKCAPAKGPWTVTTWVGHHTDHRDGPRAQAKFNNVTGVAVDSKGQVWIGDRDNHMVRAITAKGTVWTAGGNGRPGFQDGPAKNARFNSPRGLEVNSKDDVFVAEYEGKRVRRIRKGMVTTFAGTGFAGKRDGPRHTAKFIGPLDVAVDDKDVIYVADYVYLRVIHTNGMVTTRKRTIGDMGGIDVDSKGNVFAVYSLSNRIYRIEPSGKEVWLSGFGYGNNDGVGNVKGKTARYRYPTGVMLTANNQLWIADRGNHRLRVMTNTTTGKVSTLNKGSRGLKNGALKSAWFDYPFAVARNKKTGDIFVVESAADRVRKISKGVVSTYAGSAHNNHKPGQGKAARMGMPRKNAPDGKGNVYVADMFQHVILKIDKTGTLSLFSGSPNKRGTVVGKGTAARYNYPYGVGVDGKGIVYVSERHGAKIRKITPDGNSTILAGSGSGFADGKGAAAKFKLPRGIAVTKAGLVYVADTNNSKIRKVTADGTVSTLAGWSNGYADGVGKKAKFNSPYDLTLGPKGNIFVADTGTRTVRKVTPAGVVTTIAGTGMKWGFIDGGKTTARLEGPLGIGVASNGTIYISDSAAIRQVELNGTVTTLIGSRTKFVADGPKGVAFFRQPSGISVRPDGALLVSDSYARAIRVVRRAPVWPKDCNDLDGCTVDACSASAGCTHKALTKGKGMCYSGPKATLGVGICVAGVKVCGQKTCAGQVVPKKAEICGNGLDDNCNGHVDEGCLRITTMDAYNRYTCGVRTNKSLYCWGSIAVEPAGLPKGQFKKATVGENHACALRTDGKILCWGTGTSGQLKVPGGTYKDVASGLNHNCALRNDGKIICWGENKLKQASPPTTGAFKAVYAGERVSCAMRTNDTLQCWGSNSYSVRTAPQVKFKQVSMHARHACGILMDDKVRCWGSSYNTKGAPTGAGFKAVAAGREHTCLIRTNGALWCFGHNKEGKEIKPPKAGKWIGLTAGWRHTCAIRSDYRVACFGTPNAQGSSRPVGGLVLP